MTPILSLFETHLTVTNLARSITFYRDTLKLTLATHIPSGNVAFFWIGPTPGHSMLGLWETAAGPHKLQLHFAFQVALADLMSAARELQAAGIEPLDFNGNPATEPQVLAWMPAASLYFRDPDGNLLEFICMLPDPPAPYRGVVPYSQWTL